MGETPSADSEGPGDRITPPVCRRLHLLGTGKHVPATAYLNRGHRF